METPERYMRIRPKDDASAAFYAPSADITHGMKGVLRASLATLAPEPLENDHPLMLLARSLATFMKTAALSDKLWEEDGVKGVEEMFQGVSEEDKNKFLDIFFKSMMDFYWHSMRLTTEDPAIRPEEMERALKMSEMVRTMPAEMRKEYLDHVRSTGLCPKVFDRPALFVYHGEDKA